MTDLACDRVQDRLPEFAAGRLRASDAGAVSEHVAVCDECRSELARVHMLAVPVRVPPGLEARVVLAVRTWSVARPWVSRHYAVAAMFATALVTGSLLWQQIGGNGAATNGGDDLADVPTLAWPDGGDPLLHGSPGLQALSEDELLTLLRELES